jgi:hypothetical protein
VELQKRKGYHQVSVDIVGCREHLLQSMVVCYDSKCPTWLKYNLNHVYISSWAPSHCKSVFKGEFYPRFVSLSLFCFIKTQKNKVASH